MKRIGRKVQWTVTFEKELSEIRASLAPSLAATPLGLQTRSLEQMSAIKDVSEQCVVSKIDMLAQISCLQLTLDSKVATHAQSTELLSMMRDFQLQRTQHDTDISTILSDSRALNVRLDEKFAAQDMLLRSLIHQTLSLTLQNSSPATAVDVSKAGAAPDTQARHLPTHHGWPSSLMKPILEALIPLVQFVRQEILRALLYLISLCTLWSRPLRSLWTFARSPLLLAGDCIHLEDMLGREMKLQYAHFQRWPVVESLLRCNFEGRRENPKSGVMSFV